LASEKTSTPQDRWVVRCSGLRLSEKHAPELFTGLPYFA
jgi:hypothetical protein